ncbi:MAG: hypothetical protein JNK15_21680, partial [Planctomycetes bacterium]|nr:hypothetical protein [Planctomycetota bacterium]
VAASTAIAIAVLRAFALQMGSDLAPVDLAALAMVVEAEVMRTPTTLADVHTVVGGAPGELFVVRGGVAERSLATPSDLEIVGLATGTAPQASRHGGGDAGDEARAERFLGLWQGEPADVLRRELGDVMFAAHAAYAAAGCSDAVVDLAVDEARKRRDAGGAVFGAKASGRGRGGTVVLLGPHGKVWYEALRIKKALHAATGHSAHVFRWSSPGACAFGAIELRPASA